MKRKVAILNILLVAALAYEGWQFRGRWLTTAARQAEVLNQKPKPAPAPPFTPLPVPPPVMPAGYADIAQKTLFDRSRNPIVVIEEPPPPPPKPMPPLPSYHGTMNLGDGPAAILSIGTGAHQEVHPGETFGQFKLVDVNTQEIVFEWEGKTVRRKIEDVTYRGGAATDAASTARTETPAGAARIQSIAPVAAGPGASTGGGMKACVPNDSTPAGSVVDGLRKTVYDTPFGQACRWEPAR